jgi:hypothetical protein
MSRRDWAVRCLVWLGLAVALLAPASLSPSQLLVGHPDVDVWNHAWGYWFVPQAIADLSSPVSTNLIAPEGGALYFIDMLGALLGAPLAWTLGAAVAYNAVLILRVAAAGLAAQCLTEHVTGRGAHAWVAGVAFASAPYLLSELHNGITEVATVHWIAWVMLATQRVREAPSPARWRWLGLLQGACSAANFYYGLVSAMMIVVVLGWDALSAWRTDRQRPSFPVRSILVAVGLAALVALPFWGTFQWSLITDTAIVVRPSEVASTWMLEHNAVDPRTFFMPGAFQSVDLAAQGEAFLHTGYLRWSLLGLAIMGALSDPRLRPWVWAGLLSAVMGLGPFLWWGEHVMIGGRHVSLPFYWIQLVLPDVAITHTLRLAVGAQLVTAMVGAAGLAALAVRVPRLGATGLAAGAAILVLLEGTTISPAPWPVASSDATIPQSVQTLGPGPVLDLPGSVGATMATSRYFWYQTAHGRPVPWTPNVRLDSCRDLDVQGAFTNPRARAHSHQVVEDPGSGPDFLQKSLLSRYSAIVVHTQLAERADLPSSYVQTLTTVLGPPEAVGDLRIWRGGGEQ